MTDEYAYKMVKEGGVANGKSALMVAWGPALGSDAKVRDVTAYVRSLGKPAPAPAKAPAKAEAPKVMLNKSRRRLRAASRCGSRLIRITAQTSAEQARRTSDTTALHGSFS